MGMNTYPLDEKAVLMVQGKLAAAINAIDWMILGNPDPTAMSDENFVNAYGDIALAHDAMEERDVEGLCFCSEFQGDAITLNGDQNVTHYDDDYICYIPCKKEPSLFSAAYAGFNDLKAEFEEILDQAGLMKTVHDFNIDLADYICSLTGTYFC